VESIWLVALVVGKAKLGRAEDAQETGLATAMLHVGPASLSDGRHVEAVARLDESGLVFRKRVAFRSALDALGLPVVTLLRCAH
jgi:hypothetical protein